MFSFKVVVAGPFGAGKTTMIRNASSGPVVGTEVATTGDEAARKPTTTVGIEYGVYTLDEVGVDAELVLIGTPGQLRFDEVRTLACIGMDALVVLVDASDPGSWDAAALLASSLRTASVPLAVGVNRGRGGDADTAEIRRRLHLDRETVVMACDVADRRQVRRLLVEVLVAVLDRLGDGDGDGAEADAGEVER